MRLASALGRLLGSATGLDPNADDADASSQHALTAARWARPRSDPADRHHL
jgi:hypothetical protein